LKIRYLPPIHANFKLFYWRKFSVVNHGLEVCPISDQPIWDIFLGFARKRCLEHLRISTFKPTDVGTGWWLEGICSGNMA
jgi:hypothetical protein